MFFSILKPTEAAGGLCRPQKTLRRQLEHMSGHLQRAQLGLSTWVWDLEILNSAGFKSADITGSPECMCLGCNSEIQIELINI